MGWQPCPQKGKQEGEKINGDQRVFILFIFTHQVMGNDRKTHHLFRRYNGFFGAKILYCPRLYQQGHRSFGTISAGFTSSRQSSLGSSPKNAGKSSQTELFMCEGVDGSEGLCRNSGRQGDGSLAANEHHRGAKD